MVALCPRFGMLADVAESLNPSAHLGVVLRHLEYNLHRQLRSSESMQWPLNSR